MSQLFNYSCHPHYTTAPRLVISAKWLQTYGCDPENGEGEQNGTCQLHFRKRLNFLADLRLLLWQRRSDEFGEIQSPRDVDVVWSYYHRLLVRNPYVYETSRQSSTSFVPCPGVTTMALEATRRHTACANSICVRSLQHQHHSECDGNECARVYCVCRHQRSAASCASLGQGEPADASEAHGASERSCEHTQHTRAHSTHAIEVRRGRRMRPKYVANVVCHECARMYWRLRPERVFVCTAYAAA